MSVFRIYPQKNNTIASNINFESINSGQNAVTELWYGGGIPSSNRRSISRYLVKFDLSELQRKFTSGEIMSGNVTSYKLKMHNSIPRDAALEPNFEFDRLEKNIAASFDLIAFPINKDWDEGRGYDMLQEDYLIRQKGNPLLTGFSNWNYATQMNAWDEPGIFANPVTAVTAVTLPTQHFDIGDENLDMDITELVNYWLVSGNTNYGLAVAYRRDYETITSNTRAVSSFLTRHTNSAFKAHLEVNYNQVIKDDRNQVTNNRTSRLFLYTFSGNTTVDPSSIGNVTIQDPSGASIFTGLTPTRHSKGTYYVDVLITGGTRGQRYKDIWNDVVFVPGVDIQNYSQSFQIRDNYYLNSSPEINEYTATFYGIEDNKIVRNDEIIRLFCNLRVNFSKKNPSPNYELKYRLIMNNQEEVIPWTSFNRSIRNNCEELFVDLDTSWLLHNQTYEFEFKIEELGSIRILPEHIKFRVQRPF